MSREPSPSTSAIRLSRRRALQAALTTAAVAALPRAQAAAQQATPVAVGAALISAAQVKSAVARLDGLVEDAMARTRVPGAAVAVVYGDAVIYERGFGVRELGKADPVTADTVFQIASMSKAVSSTLVAAVVGDGATTWDATISSIEPGFALADPWVSAQVSLSDMFSHRSGLPAYAGDALVSTFGYERDETLRRLRYVPLATPFRTTFAYANVPLAAAAYAAARAAGQTWEDLAAARLFTPLKMTSTSYRFADYMGRANRAAPHYRKRDGGWDHGEVTVDDAVSPAAGVSSSVRDLTSWLRLQLAGGTFAGRRVVASGPLLETRRPHILAASPPDPAAGPASFYGLGWYVEYDNRGRLLVQVPGDFSDGFETSAYMLPAAGLGIIVLTNGWPNPLRDAIPRAFLEIVEQGEPTKDWVGILDAQTTAAITAAFSSPFPESGPPSGGVPALPLDNYLGTFTNQLYGDVTARKKNGGLVLEVGPKPIDLALQHWDRDTFRYALQPSTAVLVGSLSVVFTIGPDGKAEAVTLNPLGSGTDTTTVFTRVR